jgi:hypothetical protein
VALLGVGIRHARNRGTSPPVKRTLFLLALASSRQWWNPSTWWNTVQHLGSDAVSDIEDWVKDFVNLCFSIYDEAEQLAIELINGLINLVGYVASVAYSWGQQALTGVDVLVSSWIPEALDDVKNTVLGWVNDAISAASEALGDVYGWAVDAFNTVDGVLDAIYNEYVVPAVDWIANAGDWFYNELDGWWDEFWDYAIGPVINDLSNLGGWIDTAGDFLYGEVTDAIHLVEEATDWLVWFGEHTFDDLENLFSQSTSGVNETWLLGALGGLDQANETASENFAKILGD